jgi:hypothetical protein
MLRPANALNNPWRIDECDGIRLEKGEDYVEMR